MRIVFECPLFQFLIDTTPDLQVVSLDGEFDPAGYVEDEDEDRAGTGFGFRGRRRG